MWLKNLVFRQLLDKETCTYTYLLGDFEKKQAILIDPVLENAERDAKLLVELKLALLYTLETHIHADHITAASAHKAKLGSQIVVPKASSAQNADREIGEGDVLSFGEFALKALSTSGHTAHCLSYLMPGAVFTGDALFIRGTGRTDFQEGNAKALYENVRKKIFSLPSETLIFPAHDYQGISCSTVGEEMEWNPRLGGTKTAQDYIEIMKNLKLDPPKKMKQAVPANLKCGQ